MSVIKEFLKTYLKPHLIRSGILLTRNMRYDRQAWLIMKRILRKDDSCVDVGCHKGELMDWMLQLSPEGKHAGFEPIPSLFSNLQAKYGQRVKLYNCALGKEQGEANFQVVKDTPAYSGLKKRKYLVENPEIEEVHVKVETLDNLFAQQPSLKLLKVDVEGGEFDVLSGGKDLILRCRPFVLFEFGLGSAEFYGSGPELMYDLLQEVKLNVFCLGDFLSNNKPLSKDQFKQHFDHGSEYYFIAAPIEALTN
jgi:FkbM family methyltransferase